MAGGRLRVLHVLNQFFAGLGGEDKADLPPAIFMEPRGPGRALQSIDPELEVVATVASGDNYVAEHTERAAKEIVALIEARLGSDAFDLVVAGPAFLAGRYGLACCAICSALEQRFGVPGLVALNEENPAVATYRRELVMVRTGTDVMGMQDALAAMADVAPRLAAGETLSPDSAPVLSRGLRRNRFAERTGAERAIDMLMRKLAGEAPVTEYPMPKFERVPPAPAIGSASEAVIALVTSGGIVPRGNPDHIESASASRYGRYSIAGLDALSAETHQSVHGGYDPSYANADPNRVLPLDAARALEREGRIGRLFDSYFATVGNATSVRQAQRFGEEIAATLVNEGVQAVIFTST